MTLPLVFRLQLGGLNSSVGVPVFRLPPRTPRSAAHHREVCRLGVPTHWRSTGAPKRRDLHPRQQEGAVMTKHVASSIAARGGVSGGTERSLGCALRPLRDKSVPISRQSRAN